jgi:hypothetical protein
MWWKMRPANKRARLIAIGVVGSTFVILMFAVDALLPRAASVRGPAASTYVDTLMIVDSGSGPRVVAFGAMPSASALRLCDIEVWTTMRYRRWLGATLGGACSWNWRTIPRSQWPPANTTEIQAIDALRGQMAGLVRYRGEPMFDVPAMIRANVMTARVWHWSGFALIGVLLMVVALVPIGLILLAPVSRLEVGTDRLIRGLCPRCKYQLAGLSGGAGACPECGEGFEVYRRVVEKMVSRRSAT